MNDGTTHTIDLSQKLKKERMGQSVDRQTNTKNSSRNEIILSNNKALRSIALVLEYMEVKRRTVA